MRIGLFATLTLSFLVPGMALAQSLGGSLSTGDLFTVSTSPQYPAPYTQSTLSFLSSSLDLTNATLTATLGGKQIYQGSIRPITVPLGGAGSVAAVTVTITSNGVPYKKSVVIQPQDVSLITEPLATAPVLYPGKALPPLGGDVRVVALASFKDAGGKIIDPNTLSYSWKVDDAFIANSSGIGKNVIIVASPMQYRLRTVSVSIQSQNGSLVGGDSLNLMATDPTVRVYENDPLLGIRFDHALSGSYSITGSESSLFAAPFSFPSVGGPILQWFLNGSSAQLGSSITLRPAGTGQGNASLSLTASAGDSSKATADLSLIFGTKPTSNFFGL